MLIRVQTRARAFAHELPEEPRKLIQPAHFLDPRAFPRLLLRQLVALPCRDQFARLAQEKNLAMLLIRCAGEEHEDRLLLIDAGEIEKVRILNEPDRPIRIRWQNVVRIRHREHPRLQECLQSGAVFGEKSPIPGLRKQVF